MAHISTMTAVPGNLAGCTIISRQKRIGVCFDSGKIVATVYRGQQSQISAGSVKGRRVTSWPSAAIDLKTVGAIVVDHPVVRGGNIITSRRPEDLPGFNQTSIQALF